MKKLLKKKNLKQEFPTTINLGDITIVIPMLSSALTPILLTGITIGTGTDTIITILGVTDIIIAGGTTHIGTLIIRPTIGIRDFI